MKFLFRVLTVCFCLAVAGCITEGGAQQKPSGSPEEAASVNLELGSAYLRRGDIEAAVEKLQKAVDQNPDLATAHSTLALAYDRQGLSDQASKHYRIALKKSDGDPAILNTYGAHLCRNNKMAEAEAYFLKAATNPRYGTPEAAYSNAGVCALRNDELEKAEDYFRSALRINPRYPDALWNMADLSHSRDRDLQARAFLQRLGDAGNLPPGALWLGIQIERSLGDRAAIDRYALRLKTKFPESRETALLLDMESNGG